MNEEFPVIFIVYQGIKPASLGSDRVYHTAIVSEKNASTITVFQITLFSSFHDEIFEPVSLPRDSFYINTRERHTGLYATFDTAVNRAWNTAAQEMSPGFIILFRIEFFAFQEKRLLKCLSFLFFNRASGILGSCMPKDKMSLTQYVISF